MEYFLNWTLRHINKFYFRGNKKRDDKLAKMKIILVLVKPCVVKHYACKVVQPEGGVDVGFGLQVVSVGPVPLVQLVQQGLENSN